jgi:DNA-binding XRE family transcriptional regulator
MPLINRLREYREAAKLSREDLAERVRAAGVSLSRQALWNIEERNTLPKLELAFQIADALGKSVLDIWKYEHTRKGKRETAA